MKESVYKSAMSRLRTSGDYEDKTYAKLMAEASRPKSSAFPTIPTKERYRMDKTIKRQRAGWAIGVAACAALTIGLLSANLSSPATKTADPSAVATQPAVTQPAETETPPAQTRKPPVTGKAAVNIEGVITEVSADGKSFKVGDLWVAVTPDTKMGIDGPTAAEPSEELLSSTFKVGNIVSGFTTEDIGSGKVNAARIYNNIVPQP